MTACGAAPGAELGRSAENNPIIQEDIVRQNIAWLTATALVSFVVVGATAGGDDKKKEDVLAGWTHDFSAEKPDLVSSGRNPYFILEPG